MHLMNTLKKYSCTIKKPTSVYLIIISTLFFFNIGIAQEHAPYSLGSEAIFTQNLISDRSQKQLSNEPNLITLKISDKETLSGKINVTKGTTESYVVIGAIENNGKASFTISKDKGSIEGEIILIDKKKAYQYYSDDNDNVLIKEIDINEVLCIGSNQPTAAEEGDNLNPFYLLEAQQAQAQTQAVDLQSQPGVNYTVYLDFDGEVVSDTSWVDGDTINAASSGFNDDEITTIWKIMTEDFRPFNLNVTTNRDVYEATPLNQRIMCIFTPTDNAAPGSGGVAYINSFSNTRVDNPCWVYSSRANSAGGTGSHEVGHALGLGHDGIIQGTTYYSGQGSWSPIMGGGGRLLSQWSKGEYDNADNDQDDLAVIAGDRNGFGYKLDDHGNTVTEASELIFNADGQVNASENTGIISTTEDKDVFSFITAGGEVNFNFEPDPLYPNLNIQVRILNAVEEEIEISSPNEDLSANISTSLAGGTYFIEVDGVGEGNLSDGFSDYACLGLYSISGSYDPGNNNQPPVANFEASQECDQVTFTSTSINIVNSYAWDFGDGNTSTAQNPVHNYTNGGTYTVSLSTANDVGTNTKTESIDIIVASTPQSVNQNICNGESATIILNDSSAEYIWYDQEEGNTIITTGNSFETPELTEDKVYYVSGATKTIVTGTTGIQNINENSGNIHDGGQSLIFDLNEPILLNKAKVLANGSGNRTLLLRSETGELLESKEINIPDGESIIDINLSIPAGNNLEIGFSEGSNLFRNNEDTNYPYEINDIISIKSSTSETAPLDYYYYLYDWQITTLGGCETNDRAMVSISVSDYPEVPSLTLDPDSNIINVNENFTSYQWYLNDEIIIDATENNYLVEEIGAYKIEVSNENGCSTFSENIDVTVDDLVLSVDIITNDDTLNLFKIYPVPTTDILHIDGLSDMEEINSIRVVNALGQVLITYDSLIKSVDTSYLTEGLYFLIINDTITKKFLK